MGNCVDARKMHTVMNIKAFSSAAQRGGDCDCTLHLPSCPCGPAFFRGNQEKWHVLRTCLHVFEELRAGSLPALGILPGPLGPTL